MPTPRPPDGRPLAERMRPRSFDEVVGQARLLGPDGVLRAVLDEGRTPSLILWGPPGCGKTTIARLVAEHLDRDPVSISAVTSGVKELKEIIARARDDQRAFGQGTLLFVDEIHRFNRSQQDTFLGPVEEGLLVLIGATTENPSFELNSALLSRCRVIPFEPLERADLGRLLDRALTDRERGLGTIGLALSDDLRELLLDVADGDARALLTDLEWLATAWRKTRADVDDPSAMTASEAREVLTRLPRYDKAGEEHYNLLSALHKSLRGSDAQAGLYWLARMLEGGEAPLVIARRLVRFASEDVGLADPQALALANAAREAVEFLGLPEGNLALAEAVVYLASAPKSDRIYRAFARAVDAARRYGALPVPLAIRNAPTRTMKELGYGQGYHVPHGDSESGDADDDRGHRVRFLPEVLHDARFYRPREIGFEREIKKRMEYFERLREEARRSSEEPS